MEPSNWFTRLQGVEGWLGDNEATLLYRLAQRCEDQGVIVEIGSWKGRSTICLASGSLAGRCVPVYAIDPHQGHDGEGQRGPATFSEFQANVHRAGVERIVRPIVATSDEAAKSWNRRIEMLWIDGAHTYENASRDFDSWSPYLTNGGVIAFHDSTPSGVRGVRHAVSERVLRNPFFTDIGVVGTITYATRSPSRRFSMGKWKLLAMYWLFDLGGAVIPQRFKESLRDTFNRLFWKLRPGTG